MLRLKFYILGRAHPPMADLLCRSRTLLSMGRILPRVWLEALLELIPIVIESANVQPGGVPQHAFDNLLHWLVVDVQLGEKIQVFADQVDVDLVSLSLVQRVEAPLDAVGQVLLEDALKPLHSLPECQRLPVVANELVGAPIEQSICLNVIELPRNVLPDDLDG